MAGGLCNPFNKQTDKLLSYNTLFIKYIWIYNHAIHMYSKTPIYQATGGKELGPVNQEAWYIGVHFALIYT